MLRDAQHYEEARQEAIRIAEKAKQGLAGPLLLRRLKELDEELLAFEWEQEGRKR